MDELAGEALSSVARQLSARELCIVRDALEKPLTGRPVHVPFGGRAFFRGQLSPHGSPDDISGEHVSLRLADGSAKAVRRLDTLDLFKREIEKRKPDRKVSDKESNVATSVATTASTHPTTAIAGSATNPFVEIREELNDSGQEVRAEAIDVTRHLDYLRRASDGDTKNEDDSAFIPRESSNASSLEVDLHVDRPQERDFKQQQLSDCEYQALIARLDQLALLEEEAETQKNAKGKSAHSLQSSGWSKGFLNKKATTTKKLSQSIPVGKSTAASDEPSKSVSFQETDQVKEIPRIGDKSISRPSSNSPRPLDPSLFPGAVVEKSRPTAKEIRKTADPPEIRQSRFVQQRQEMLQTESALPLKQSKFSKRR